MLEIIKDVILEFKWYSEEHFYSIEQVKSWLSDNMSLYKDVNFEIRHGSCFDDIPCEHRLRSAHNTFIHLFDSLEEIVELHKYESYFQQELLKYQLIKEDVFKLKDWVRKNEQLSFSDFSGFSTRFLGYNEEPYHLYVYSSIDSDYHVFLDRNDFVNTITFFEIFDKLFWEDRILPESIKAIEDKYNTIKILDVES